MKINIRECGAPKFFRAALKNKSKLGLLTTIFAALLVTLLALLSPSAFAQTELISNGSFQSGSSGWVLSGNLFADPRFATCPSWPGYAYLSDLHASPPGT